MISFSIVIYQIQNYVHVVKSKLLIRTLSTLPFQINIDILLYGGELLSDEENILMNQQTLTFILESKRFN